MGTPDKKSLKAVLVEFRRSIAHYASGKRIRQLLGEAIHLAFQEVKDPELRAWERNLSAASGSPGGSLRLAPLAQLCRVPHKAKLQHCSSPKKAPAEAGAAMRSN
jgi:hypothetical protein